MNKCSYEMEYFFRRRSHVVFGLENGAKRSRDYTLGVDHGKLEVVAHL